MGILPVDTASVREALNGRSGIQTVRDYRGERVLSAYGPLELDTMRWAVIAEIDEEEAQAPILAYARKVIVVATGTALLVTLIALLASHVLTRPLRQLTLGARRLGAGETEVRVAVASQDEFGELARVFNEMAGNIHRQRERLEQQVRENRELLLSILPASAVAQREEGDAKASREFADVTVLFADIIGMEAFSSRAGEARSLAVLGDLIDAFDEAAEEAGIEKVKTIGASYLAVCGLSVSRPDHTRRVVAFALELVRIIGVFNRDHRAELATELALAVGVNSGPVVGGVVGRRKFLYDLWGNTVTIARRLGAGQGRGVHVTALVQERLAGQFQFRGPVAAGTDHETPVEYWEVIA
jgi:class 3 adenylate cyclase